MKNSTPIFVKQIISLLRSMAKAKSMAIKSKTEAIRARLLVFSLLRNNKKLSLVALSHKIHSLLLGAGGHHQEKETGHDEEDDHHSEISIINNINNQLLQCSSSTQPSHQNQLHELQVPKDDYDLDTRCCYSYYHPYDHGDDLYPDLTHSLFEATDHDVDEEREEDELGDPNASVIDLVRNSKEEGGENFSLEAEIDHVADLFIMKFHKKMQLQKLESFKRYQEMLQRSA